MTEATGRGQYIEENTRPGLSEALRRMRLIPAELIPARRRPFRWSGSGKETKGATNLDRIEAGEGTSSAIQMVREWQENKGLEVRAGKRCAQNDGTNVLATDHLLPFPTLLSARQLSVLAMASEPSQATQNATI